MKPPEIEIALEHSAWTNGADREPIVRQAVADAMAAADIDGEGRSVSVLLTSDDAMAALNGRFRDKPIPTNVLSWPAEDLEPAKPGDRPPAPGRAAHPDEEAETLGDMALAFETVDREASEAGKPEAAHLFHLVVHGTLHLLGYDHVADADAERMEALESRICLAAGYDDPYLAVSTPEPRMRSAAASEQGS